MPCSPNWTKSAVVAALILRVYLSSEFVCGNYPDSIYNRRPCITLKNTVAYQGPLCKPTSDGLWEEQSQNNCRDVFRKTHCPEFNRGECVWHLLKFPNQSFPELLIPCCRLKYFARDYTWFEALYSNQYGTSLYNSTAYDVVEINRRIKNHEAFGKRDQDDWPASVLDPQSERGVTWITMPLKILAYPFPNPKPSDPPLCSAPSDPRCLNEIGPWMIKNYKLGFDGTKVPPNTETENDTQATIDYQHRVSCIDIVFDNKRSRACQIIFVKIATFSIPHDTLIPEVVSTEVPYLEMQTFSLPASAEYAMRYAYYNVESPELREQIN